MEWQARAVLPLLLVSLPFSQPGAVQFDPSTIDSTIANNEFVFVNFYADWYVLDTVPVLVIIHFSIMTNQNLIFLSSAGVVKKMAAKMLFTTGAGSPTCLHHSGTRALT